MTRAAAGGRQSAVSVVIPTRDRWPLLATTLAERARAGRRPARGGGRRRRLGHGGAGGGPFDDPRVRIVRNDRSLRRRRRPQPRHRGGAWGVDRVLDDDDVWAPTKLRRQLDAAAAARASFAYAGVILVTAVPGRSRFAGPPAPIACPAPRRLQRDPAGASNVVVAEPAWHARLGGFDPSFGHPTDWDLWGPLPPLPPAAALRRSPCRLSASTPHMCSDGRGAFAELARFDRMHGRPGAHGHPALRASARPHDASVVVRGRTSAPGRRRVGCRWDAGDGNAPHDPPRSATPAS